MSEGSLLNNLSKQVMIGTIQVPLNGGNKVKLSDILAGADAKIDRLERQLQTAKEENEKLRNQNNLFKGTIKKFNLDWYGERLTSLTQQNKQMLEALEKAKKMFIEQGHCPWADGTGKFDCESCNDNCMFPSIQQALNQLKGVE